MESIIISIVMAVLEGVPKLVAAIQTSQSMDEAAKTKALFDINLRLTEATVHVQSVRFRQVEVTVPPPPKPTVTP